MCDRISPFQEESVDEFFFAVEEGPGTLQTIQISSRTLEFRFDFVPTRSVLRYENRWLSVIKWTG